MARGFDNDWLLRHQIRAGLTGDRRAKVADVSDEPESKLHEQIEAHCAAQGWLTVRSRMDRKTTTRKGVCDFIIYADGGRMFSVECKTAIGKLTLEQQSFAVWLNKLGHKVVVVRSFTEFLEAVR